DLLPVKPAKDRSLSQLLIKGQKQPALRNIFTPLQACGQLQSVGSPQVVAVHKLRRFASERVGGLNDEPRVRQRLSQSARFRPITCVEQLHPHESRQGAGNLNRSCPPHYSLVGLVERDDAGCSALSNAERNKSACVPKCQMPLYRFSRSSRHICSMTSSGMAPGGSGHETGDVRFFIGGVRIPLAISCRSRSGSSFGCEC